MLQDNDLTYLKNLSIFAGLSGQIVDSVGAHARRVEIAGSEVLFHEGDPAREMLVVLRGTLEVIKHGAGGGEACIATLGPGDVVGEMSLIDIQPRSAEVRSVGPASLVVLSHADIAAIYKEDKPSHALLVLNIAREISLRLRKLDTLLATIMLDISSATGGQLNRPNPDGANPHVG